MKKGNSIIKKENKKYKVPGATIALGDKLKKRRISLKYSLSDVAEMTGFSTSTIVDVELGQTADVNYYIAYAQTLDFKLPELFDLKIPYKPRFQLSPKKQARTFLTDRIKELYTEHDFFAEKQGVGSVAEKLLALKAIKEITPYIRTRISGVLLTLVSEDMLFIAEVQGRNNIYLKNKK